MFAIKFNYFERPGPTFLVCAELSTWGKKALFNVFHNRQPFVSHVKVAVFVVDRCCILWTDLKFPKLEPRALCDDAKRSTSVFTNNCSTKPLRAVGIME